MNISEIKEWELTYAILKRDLKKLKKEVSEHPDHVKLLKHYLEGIEEIIKELRTDMEKQNEYF
jgi:hypothetical protein